MWRAFFLAIGVTLCILGFECMVLDQAVLAAGGRADGPVTSALEYDAYGFAIDQPSTTAAAPKTIEPPEWATWSLLSCGTIVLLYSVTRRFRGD